MPSAIKLVRQIQSNIEDSEARIAKLEVKVAALAHALEGIWEELLTPEQRKTLMHAAAREASNIVIPENIRKV
jgi:cell division septum initiation protein DivIVA